MSDLAKILFMVLLIAAAFTVACKNYHECRRQGFSVRYCVTTHAMR